MIGKVLSWSTAFVLIAAVSATANPPPATAAGPGNAAACDAALALIKDQIAHRGDQRRLAVVGSAGSRDDGVTAANLRKDMKKDRPPAALAAQFVGRQERDPLAACPKIVGFLDQAGVIHDQKTIDAMSKGPPGARTSAVAIFSLSLPTVSADGREALADVGTDAGPHGSLGQVVHLRKDSQGQWRTTDAMTSWTG